MPTLRSSFDPVSALPGKPFDPKAGLVSLHGWAWQPNPPAPFSSLYRQSHSNLRLAPPSNGLEQMVLQIRIDTQVGMTDIVANVSRPDLPHQGAAPDEHHGFIVSLPPDLARSLQTGNHTIAVYAAHPTQQPKQWQQLTQSPRCLCNAKPCSCQYHPGKKTTPQVGHAAMTAAVEAAFDDAQGHLSEVTAVWNGKGPTQPAV